MPANIETVAPTNSMAVITVELGRKARTSLVADPPVPHLHFTLPLGVSSDRLANSGLRVQASCMGMGQAAGVATLAAKSGTTPLEVPLTDIHALLREHGQIIPGRA